MRHLPPPLAMLQSSPCASFPLGSKAVGNVEGSGTPSIAGPIRRVSGAHTETNMPRTNQFGYQLAAVAAAFVVVLAACTGPAPQSAPAAAASQPGASSSSNRPAVPAAGAPVWHYEGAEGPANWGKLSPAFAACGEGRHQSPIDISKPARGHNGRTEDHLSTRGSPHRAPRAHRGWNQQRSHHPDQLPRRRHAHPRRGVLPARAVSLPQPERTHR